MPVFGCLFVYIYIYIGAIRSYTGEDMEDFMDSIYGRPSHRFQEDMRAAMDTPDSEMFIN